MEEKVNAHIYLLKPEIEKLIEKKEWKAIKEAISILHPSDIADLLREFDVKYSVILLRLLPSHLQSEVFSELDSEHQLQILNNLTAEDVKSIITELHPDDRTELFEDLPPKLTRRLLNILPPEQRKEALQLLGYPENSVGRLMTPDYVALKKNWTVEKAIEHIKEYGKDAETIDVLYVVDEKWHLMDEIPIRRLILADKNQTVESLMDYQFVSINVNADQEEAIKLFEKYNLVALPVTDSEGHLLGIVTVDDIIDALKSTVEELDVFNLEPTADLIKMVSLLENGTLEIRDALKNLKQYPAVAMEHAKRAKATENRMNHLYLESLAEIFDNAKNSPGYMMKIREVYRHLNRSADRCDDAANVISDIIIKSG